MSPIQVDFYLLSDSRPDACLLFACRLLEKAYLQNLTTWVWCQNEIDASELDLKLWSFKVESFIPHARNNEHLPQKPLIEIATHYPSTCSATLLLNLSTDVVLPSPTLLRILEIVPNIDAAKIISRTHYRAYRAAKYHLNTHEI